MFPGGGAGGTVGVRDRVASLGLIDGAEPPWRTWNRIIQADATEPVIYNGPERGQIPRGWEAGGTETWAEPHNLEH